MLIEIQSGDAKSKRKVTVTEDGKKLAEFVAPNLLEAHKMLAKGRKDGWDSLK